MVIYIGHDVEVTDTARHYRAVSVLTAGLGHLFGSPLCYLPPSKGANRNSEWRAKKINEPAVRGIRRIGRSHLKGNTDKQHMCSDEAANS